MSNKPKKWVAVLLGVVAPPIALMYVVQLRWAGIYLFLTLAVGLGGEFYAHDPVIVAATQVAFAVICATHAYRFALKYPDEQRRPAYSRWYGLLGAAAGLFSVAFAVRAFVVEPFRFLSGSMLPTIPLRAHLIVEKWGYGNYGTYGIHLFRSPISAPLARGDIVVFEFPPDRSIHYAKRLIGLPGDKIAYRGKKLSVNGDPAILRQAADYLGSKALAYRSAFIESLKGVEYSVLIENETPPSVAAHLEFPFRDHCSYDSDGITCIVPDGHYFTMGDNRDNSYDSRMWGFVPSDHIVGRVLYVVP